MSNIRVWILTGETGEYSDRTEWLVRAYTDKAKAEAECLKFCEWLRENGVYMDSVTNKSSIYDLKFDLDPNFQCDYTGTRYYLQETELES